MIPPDSEAIFYGILDFCAKPVFSVMLIAGHWNIDPGRLGLRIRDVGEEIARDTEKRGPNQDGEHNGVSTGVDRP